MVKLVTQTRTIDVDLLLELLDQAQRPYEATVADPEMRADALFTCAVHGAVALAIGEVALAIRKASLGRI